VQEERRLYLHYDEVRGYGWDKCFDVTRSLLKKVIQMPIKIRRVTCRLREMASVNKDLLTSRTSEAEAEEEEEGGGG